MKRARLFGMGFMGVGPTCDICRNVSTAPAEGPSSSGAGGAPVEVRRGKFKGGRAGDKHTHALHRCTVFRRGYIEVPCGQERVVGSGPHRIEDRADRMRSQHAEC